LLDVDESIEQPVDLVIFERIDHVKVDGACPVDHW
jgi:hypothetical protein